MNRNSYALHASTSYGPETMLCRIKKAFVRKMTAQIDQNGTVYALFSDSR